MARHTDAVALGSLTVLVFLFYWKLWLRPSHILFSGFSDLILSRASWQELIRKTLFEHGELPLWNPHIFCGIPFIGNPGSWAFYPVNWLFVLLPVNLSTTAIVLFHLVLGATGAYAHLRWGLRGSVWPSLTGALVFVFGGKLLIHLLVPGHLGFIPLVWVPWALLTVDCLARTPSWRTAALLGVVLGMLGLSLFTQFCLYSACLIGAYFAYRWGRDPHRSWRVPLQFCAAGLLAGLLCAVQLLPAMGAAGESARVAFGSPEFASAGSLGLQDCVASLRPTIDSVAGWAGETFAWEQTFYLGLLPLLLLPFALSTEGRRADSVFFLSAGLVALLHALGRHTPFFAFLYEHVPGFGYFRVPGRTLFMAGFCVPVLVAVGLEAVTSLPSKRGLYTGWLLALVGVTCGFSFGSREWLAGAGPWLLCLGLAYAVALWVLIARRELCHVASPALVVTLLVELWSFHSALLQTRPFSEVFPPDRIRELALDSWFTPEARVTDAGREVFHPLITEYELVREGGYDVNGFNPLVSERYVRFMSGITGQPPKPEVWIPGLKPDPPGGSESAALLRYFNLEQWVGAGRHPQTGALTILRKDTEHRLPRAYLAPSMKVARSEEVLDELPGAEIGSGRAVVLEEDAPQPPGTAKFRPVSYDAYSPNTLRLSATLEAPAYLVLSESWHPGWRCWDRGGPTGERKELKVYRANYLFRAVYLTQGKHALTFRFLPRSYCAGRILSLLGLLIVTGLLLGPILLKRGRTGDSSA